MALSMLDKSADHADKSAWPAEIAAEFEREKQNHNRCVGSTLLSENEQGPGLDHPPRPRRANRLPPPRARLFLDLGFRRTRPPALQDGTTVEYTYRRAKPATRPTARANTRSTIWKISATRRWSS